MSPQRSVDAGPIHCARLDLISLGPPVLRAICDRDATALNRLLPFTIDQEWLASVPAARRLAQLEVDPALQPWLARAMVLRSENRAVGYIGCHDQPDGQRRIELGYQVLAADRRLGYAREAVDALVAWAVGQGATGLILSISPTNEASLALARTLGLHQTGEQMDEIDGLELIFERSLP